MQDVQGAGSDPVVPDIRPDGSDDPAGRQRYRRVTVLIEAAGD
ncbi:hypothetical protein [Frateuria soli]|nr:hypothetical protein [Frateuria soli]